MTQPNIDVNSTNSKGFTKFLNLIEKIGNKLPHPFILFLYLAVGMIVLSWVVSLFNVSVTHPGTGETLEVKSLLSGEGLQFILSSTLTNFTGFAPLGLVLTMMLGIGLAEKVGLLESVMKKAILKAHGAMVTFTVFFIGILGNVASDAAFVVIPPLAAMVFYSVGRHPLAGLAAGVASSGIGFTANIIIAGTDALLSGISTEIAQTIDPTVVVTPLDNWFFMSASTFILAAVGTIVTEKYVEPRLGKYTGDAKVKLTTEHNPLEKKALINTLIASIIYLLIIIIGILIPNSPLLNEDGTFLRSPLMNGIIPIIFLFFVVTGITYGITIKKIQKTSDVPQIMAESIRELSGYIVLIFMISQFIAYFNWSNIATWLAVTSADFLISINLTNISVVVIFALLTAFLSLFIISGSALWALEAPIFLPMFMVLGYHPAFIQIAYRIGESSTNMITPLNPYFAIILAYMNEYDKKAGIGTLMALMIPYTIAFLSVWIVMLLAFGLLGIPVGPGISMYL